MPNPFVTRAISIVYGAGGTMQTIAGTSKLIMDGVYRLDLKYATGSFRCRFWVSETSDATFIATCAAIEANLTLPRQRLQIQIFGVNQEDFNPDPAVNTGFNQRVQLTKPDDPLNTTRTRVYEWLCEFDRPAVLAGQAGRLESTVDLSVEPGGRRRLKLSGTYTALTTNSGRAQYTAAIGTPAYNGGVGTGYIGTLTTGFGGSWEIVSTPQAAADDTNKILRFSIDLRDLLLNESVALLHDHDLTDQFLTVRRTWIAPGDTQGTVAPVPKAPAGGGAPQDQPALQTSLQDLLGIGSLFSGDPTSIKLGGQGGGAAAAGNTRRLQSIDVEYSVWVTNRAVDLVTKWNSTIVPWILAHVTRVASLSIYAVVRIAPQFDYVNSRIQASLSFLAPNGSSLLSQTITTSDHWSFGIAEAPVWSSDPDAKYLFQGPRRITRTINYVSSFVGGPTQPPPGSAGGPGYTLLDRDVSNTALTLGTLPGLGQFSICNQTITELWLFSTKPRIPTTPNPGPGKQITPGGGPGGQGPGTDSGIPGVTGGGA